MAIGVEVVDRRPQCIVLNYKLSADLNHLRIPVIKESVREDGLWNHTCFEAFVMENGGPAYREFNFSPSGAWQVYDFGGYRNGGPMMSTHLVSGECRTDANGLAMAVMIPAELLPSGDRLRLGLSAVIEQTNGKLSYWALHHPSDKPDFHHPNAFVLSLDIRSL